MDTHSGKHRILLLLKLLWNQADEAHPLSTLDIIGYLGEQGIVTDRKTVKADMELLADTMLKITHALF